MATDRAIKRRTFLLGITGAVAALGASAFGLFAGAKWRPVSARAEAGPPGAPAEITTYKPRAGGWFLSDAHAPAKRGK